MRILIVSDTHGRLENLRKVLSASGPFDMLLHCGDVEGDEDRIKELAGCQTVMVRGNNDFFSELPAEAEFNIGRYKVFITHGHRYNVSIGPEMIVEEALDRQVDIVMFGHTHKPFMERHGELIALNPGSLSYPRQEGRRPSYVIMETDKEGDIHFSFNNV